MTADDAATEIADEGAEVDGWWNVLHPAMSAVQSTGPDGYRRAARLVNDRERWAAVEAADGVAGAATAAVGRTVPDE